MKGADGQVVLGNVNGNHTLNENIADNGGLRLAHRAFHTYKAQAGDYDGAGVTDQEAEQLFFVAYAQAFCKKSTDAALKQLLATGEHAPAQWRVNGACMNNQDFGAAFQCPALAKMNPATKCRVW